MSLHDEIKELSYVARRLDAAKFDFKMSALEKLADSLDAKATSYKPDTDFLKKLSAKFLRGDYDFSRRELKNLPFINLEIFFKLIKQTAVDRMWRYREKFWRAYLPHISNTWIFLGSDAKRIARQLGDKNMGHGKLIGGTNDQSVFVFRIGQFIFSEWSHNGKLRVYPADYANHFFGLPSLSKWNISKNCLDEWIHHSPKTYSWQKTISEWLKKNCGVNKTQNDWGLED